MSNKTIAVIGNPNCGKSTLFNMLTGAHQHVGNYPGITVEKHEGTMTLAGQEVTLVDLPGTYSLTAYAQDELVARNFLVEKNPDVVLVLLDATNLERSLYLLLQIQEMGKPVILCLNMMDEVRAKGIKIDFKKLSDALGGIPVIAVSARNGEGKDDIISALENAIKNPIKGKELFISYGTDLNPVLEKMQEKIIASNFLNKKYPARWLAVKYVERDSEIISVGANSGSSLPVHEELVKAVDVVADHISKTLDTEPASIVADYRYGLISSLLRGVITRPSEERLDITDKLDKVLTHALLGPVIMLAVLYSLFWLTIELGATPQGWVENFFDYLGGVAEGILPEGDLLSLVNDGIIAGVGGVLSFAPLILIMFFFLSFLEDSGYLARMAYMLDRLFRIFGLHGASVVPYIISGGIPGGCAVPGVMASRTLRSERERIATILTAPFLSCGAKTPVFLMIAMAFFPKSAGNALFLITLAGWFAVMLVAFVLRKTVISGPATPFVMELPPYRLPTLQGLLTHTWERVWMYVKKAGTIILAVSIIIWAGMNYPHLPQDRLDAQEAQIVALDEEYKAKEFENDKAREVALEEAKHDLENEHAQEALRYSVFGRLGIALETISKPAGFDWRTNIALIGGFAAKEVIVSTLGTAYSMGEVDPGDYEEISEEKEGPNGLAKLLSEDNAWNPANAIAFMLFVLLYAPCFVTVAVIIREAGLKWGIFSMVFNTIFAYVVAVIARQMVPYFM